MNDTIFNNILRDDSNKTFIILTQQANFKYHNPTRMKNYGQAFYKSQYTTQVYRHKTELHNKIITRTLFITRQILQR